MPISCHIRDCKALLVFSLQQRYASTQTFTFSNHGVRSYVGWQFGLAVNSWSRSTKLLNASDVSPWPWPRPRLRRSRPRCYHALHVRPGLCAMKFVPLGYLFERILAVPASLAPVERGFFSNSGLIIHPHRAKMSDKLLESLYFPSVPSSTNC